MPHKHVRRAGGSSNEDFNLPPESQARPLSVVKRPQPKEDESKPNKKRKRSKEGRTKDDTPREFKRLMEMQAHMQARKTGTKPQKRNTGLCQPLSSTNPKTLSTSSSSASSRPRSGVSLQSEAPSRKPAAAAATTSSKSEPRRPRGLDDPVTNDRSTATKEIAALRQPKTRLQKKIDKRVAAWRVTETKLREKEDEAAAVRREEESDRVAGMLASAGLKLGVDEEEGLIEFGLGKERWDDEPREDVSAGGNKKKGKMGGGKKRKLEEDEEENKGRKGMNEKRAKWGLGDVVQAPPQLKKVREVFKVRKNPSGVDGGGGGKGLKEKADLSEARAEVIRRYRQMMGRSTGL